MTIYKFLAKINTIIEEYYSPYVIALGEYNANITTDGHDQVTHRFGIELLTFDNLESLQVIDKYISES